ncbi:inactive serine/threonine-protein kinase PLK5 [Phocoena sinus]|uniref:inactive serine/threonine-protein kinase PLK5 n=1 Tax=Phocoena sinus TaxID=42100 RepID=UPI0013C526BB|nr:inactive serine/threonine-protein kinase PLK5 [Phocoena sinus]
MKGNRTEEGVRERVFLADGTARAKARGPKEQVLEGGGCTTADPAPSPPASLLREASQGPAWALSQQPPPPPAAAAFLLSHRTWFSLAEDSGSPGRSQLAPCTGLDGILALELSPASPHAPAPSRAGRPERLDSTPPPSANKTRPGSARPPEQRRARWSRPRLRQCARPARLPGGMEPEPRRRRRRRRRSCRPLVSVFLRDPSSGRVYRRGKLIGEGAFSRCYKLTDMSTSSVFALKVVPHGGGGAGRLCPGDKVEREIALHSRLRHRNIVAFHGHFADRDHVYMVLEYCSRQSLAHVLEARQTLTEPEVRYYLRGLVSGLRYLHQRRIVHRDLKLSNFFLNKNMEVKIGDLGLATRVGPGGRCHRVLCGTPNFLAPEVVSRNGHSCQSDIWALGCVMYMVLTGAPPFVAAPLSEMYQNIRDGRYPEPAHLSPNARRLIARLLAPNPAERPSLDHLLQDDFFTQGFTPDRLPPHSCHSLPIFSIPQPLGRLFRRVGQLLLPQCRRPCPFTPKEASGPGEGGPDPDSIECGSEASLSEGGAPCPESPVHLLSQGTLGSDPAGPQGSPRQEVEAAIRSLQLCLDSGAPATQDPPGEQRPILWAPKWVDYSSKYGFGYQLSDGGSGVLLRDGTHMALRPAEGQVIYMPDRGRLETFALRDVPTLLGAKLAVLRLFARYMQRRLREEGGLSTAAWPAAPSLCLLRFLVSERAALLLFSDGTVQVSCRGDQAQLVLSGGCGELRLTVWEQGQPGTSYPLGVLRSHGCAPAARQHLQHAIHMLQSI